jgi:hypothetical protein
MSTESESEYSARTPDEYLKSRVRFKAEKYTAKGDMYRRCYLTTAVTSAIAAATVPVLINLNDVPLIYPTLLSLLVTILVGVEGIFHWREHWKNYDLMKSFLRQETFLYEAGAGPYRQKEPPDAFTLLVERVEEEISKERAQTIQMRTARTPEADRTDKNGTTPPKSRG